MNLNQSANGSTATATDATDTENQAPADKFYTQAEVDAQMARLRGSLEKKLLKPYAELGDPEELRRIKTEYEQRQQEQQLKRGEFEKTLQELAAKKDAEIAKRDAMIKDYKINSPLITAAARFRSVNPEQVKALLADRVRLNPDMELEVVDERGSVQYNDRGEPVGVDDLVRTFLDSNPHFRTAGPTTTNTSSVQQPGNLNGFDPSKLDLRRPADRERYRQAKKAGLV